LQITNDQRKIIILKHEFCNEGDDRSNTKQNVMTKKYSNSRAAGLHLNPSATRTGWKQRVPHTIDLPIVLKVGWP